MDVGGLMTPLEAAQEQIRAQENALLRAWAEGAVKDKRISDLLRINLTQQNAIAALRRKIGADTTAQAEAAFKGPK